MTRRRFAESTTVTVDRTRADIDTLLTRAGATQRGTFTDDDTGKALVQFRMSNRVIRLELVAPKFGGATGRELRKLEQEERAAWRRLLLILKAKLEIIADGSSTVEREFLADILLPDGRRVLEDVAPKLQAAYKTGKMPPLLGAKGEP